MRIGRLRRSEDGAALVEFAIVLPVLLLLVFGIIDFGRALSAQNSITAAVHDGARLAAVQYPVVNAQAVKDSVRRFLAPLGIAPDVIVRETPSHGAPESITVEVRRYPFRPITPLASVLGMSTIPISASATFRWEFGA
jgi:Flp pilus assembly protein TadG